MFFKGRVRFQGDVRDSVCLWALPHSDVKVRVAQPENSLVHVGYSAKGNLSGRTEDCGCQNELYVLCMLHNMSDA